jgi:hypothetical protein
MTNPIIIRNNSNGCSFNNQENEKLISIYSARIIFPCSKSQKLSSKFILLCILLFIPNSENYYTNL